MKCKNHPWYRGVYRHRTECEDCDLVYWTNHGQVANPTPQFAKEYADLGWPDRQPWYRKLLRGMGI